MKIGKERMTKRVRLKNKQNERFFFLFFKCCYFTGRSFFFFFFLKCMFVMPHLPSLESHWVGFNLTMFPQVHAGATGCLEQANDHVGLSASKIWILQGHHIIGIKSMQDMSAYEKPRSSGKRLYKYSFDPRSIH